MSTTQFRGETEQTMKPVSTREPGRLQFNCTDWQHGAIGMTWD